MPRRKIEVQSATISSSSGLVEKLVAELKSGREYGQPLVYEQEYATKKSRVTVIWDEWVDASLEERSSVILLAYDQAEGKDARDKIALASGLTVPEATAAGMLPFRIIPGLRQSDPFKEEDVKLAMLKQGASYLNKEDGLQLRFDSMKEAKACLQRLAEDLPGSEQMWIISRDARGYDHLAVSDSASTYET